MRKILLLLLLLPMSLRAQVADTMCYAIGMFGEWQSVHSADNPARVAMVGVMLKQKSKNEHIIYTGSLGYGTYHDEPRENIRYVTGNTSRMYWHRAIVNMPFVGLVIEGQRQFYKKVYLFAGLEWKAGLGSGSVDTLTQVDTRMPPPDPNGKYNYWTRTDVYSFNTPLSMFMAGLAPHIGVKLEFKRFTIGTMYMNYLWFTSMSYKNGYGTSSFDFNTSNIYRRFFVTYKF